MSEKDHVLRMLTRLENAFKYLIGMLSAIVIFLAFNYDSSAISIMATILVVVCVIGLVYVAYQLRKHFFTIIFAVFSIVACIIYVVTPIDD